MSRAQPATVRSRRKPVQSTRSAPAAANRHRTPQSLRDLAYESVKHRIITCAFKPGEYINEAQISALLGLGRTPVHQAIERLMHEGLVEVIPRKGVIVKPVSLNEVVQIIEARLMIEPEVVALATARADESELKSLNDIIGRGQQWVAARDIEQMMLLDREFHLVLARAARNDVLADILRRLHERSLRFWFISLTDVRHHRAVQEEHAAIVKSVQQRDAVAAATAMRRHIESFRANVVQYI